MPFLETEEEAAENIADINKQRDMRKKDNISRTFASPDHTDTSFLKTTEKINLNDIDNLIDRIKKNNDDHNMSKIIIADEDKVFHDYDLSYFLEDIKSGKIDNLNVKKAYNNRISRIENNLANAKKDSYGIRVYKKYINDLKNKIFRDDASDIEKDNKDGNKRSSGKGLNISSLPILLSKLNTNSSK